MKCHWCSKESRNYYCSPLCLMKHDRRFPSWMKDMGFSSDMSDEEMINVIYWNLDTDGSVTGYSDPNSNTAPENLTKGSKL